MVYKTEECAWCGQPIFRWWNEWIHGLNPNNARRAKCADGGAYAVPVREGA